MRHLSRILLHLLCHYMYLQSSLACVTWPIWEEPCKLPITTCEIQRTMCVLWNKNNIWGHVKVSLSGQKYFVFFLSNIFYIYTICSMYALGRVITCPQYRESLMMVETQRWGHWFSLGVGCSHLPTFNPCNPITVEYGYTWII